MMARHLRWVRLGAMAAGFLLAASALLSQGTPRHYANGYALGWAPCNGAPPEGISKCSHQ
jgi:hypothetical protein